MAIEPTQAKSELTPEERLRTMRAKQIEAIEVRRSNPQFKELRVTQQDRNTCILRGYPHGALIKFQEHESGMISLFCDLGTSL